MKNYDLSNTISSKKGRKTWIKNHKKLIFTLNPTIKFILFLLYNNKTLNNLLKKTPQFQMTYCQLNKYFGLLLDLGFIEKEKQGRIVTYKITEKGENYCKVLLKKFK